jgi:hypothetical protein
VLAIVLAPIVLLVGLRSAWALYTCPAPRGMHAGCCAAKRMHAHADLQAHVRASCCRVDGGGGLASAPEAQAPERSSIDDAPVALAAPAAPRSVAPTVIAMPARAVARPPPVATFRIKQALLR